MLYLIYGNNFEGARAKAHALVDVLRKKKPDAEVFRLDSENWSEAKLEEFAGGQGLFERKFIIFADRLFGDSAAKDSVFSRLAQISKSENIFIFLEGELDKESEVVLKKHAEKAQEISSVKTKKEQFKLFSLTDAFGRRDRKSLWILYRKALSSGAAPEEIHGILFWQIKSMIVASACKNAEESALNPFVYKKAQSFSRNFKTGELKNLSSKMVSIYHDARNGGPEFETALERFVLEI